MFSFGGGGSGRSEWFTQMDAEIEAAAPEPGTPQHLKDAMEEVEQRCRGNPHILAGGFGMAYNPHNPFGMPGMGNSLGGFSHISAEAECVASPLLSAITTAEEKGLVDSAVIDEARQLLSDIPSLVATKTLKEAIQSLPMSVRNLGMEHMGCLTQYDDDSDDDGERLDRLFDDDDDDDDDDDKNKVWAERRRQCLESLLSLLLQLSSLEGAEVDSAVLNKAKQLAKAMARNRLKLGIADGKKDSNSTAAFGATAEDLAFPEAAQFRVGGTPPAARPGMFGAAQTRGPEKGQGFSLKLLISDIELAQKANVGEALLNAAMAVAEERAVAVVADENAVRRDLDKLSFAIEIVKKNNWAGEGMVVMALTRLTNGRLNNAMLLAKAQASGDTARVRNNLLRAISAAEGAKEVDAALVGVEISKAKELVQALPSIMATTRLQAAVNEAKQCLQAEGLQGAVREYTGLSSLGFGLASSKENPSVCHKAAAEAIAAPLRKAVRAAQSGKVAVEPAIIEEAALLVSSLPSMVATERLRKGIELQKLDFILLELSSAKENGVVDSVVLGDAIQLAKELALAELEKAVTNVKFSNCAGGSNNDGGGSKDSEPQQVPQGASSGAALATQPIEEDEDDEWLEGIETMNGPYFGSRRVARFKSQVSMAPEAKLLQNLLHALGQAKEAKVSAFVETGKVKLKKLLKGIEGGLASSVKRYVPTFLGDDWGETEVKELLEEAAALAKERALAEINNESISVYEESRTVSEVEAAVDAAAKGGWLADEEMLERARGLVASIRLGVALKDATERSKYSTAKHQYIDSLLFEISRADGGVVVDPAALKEAKELAKELATKLLSAAVEEFKSSSTPPAAAPPPRGFTFGHPQAAPLFPVDPPLTDNQKLRGLLFALGWADRANVDDKEEATVLAKEGALAEVLNEATDGRDLDLLSAAIQIVKNRSWIQETPVVVAAQQRLATTKLQNAIDGAKNELATDFPLRLDSPLRSAIGAAEVGEVAVEESLVGEAKQLLKSLHLLKCIERSEKVEYIEALLREDPAILTAQVSSFSTFLMGSLSRRERKGSPHLWLLNGQSGLYLKTIAGFGDVPYGRALTGARRVVRELVVKLATKYGSALSESILELVPEELLRSLLAQEIPHEWCTGSALSVANTHEGVEAPAAAASASIETVVPPPDFTREPPLSASPPLLNLVLSSSQQLPVVALFLKLRPEAASTVPLSKFQQLRVRQHSKLCASTWSGTEMTDAPRKMTFARFTSKVLKRIHPDKGISERALQVIDDILLRTMRHLCSSASNLCKNKNVGQWDSPDWKQVAILGEAGGKLLLGQNGDHLDDAQDGIKWMTRESLGDEMRGKVAAWDARTTDEKLAVFRCAMIGFQLSTHTQDRTQEVAYADLAVFEPGEQTPNKFQRCEFPGGINSRDVQMAVRVSLVGALAKHAEYEGTRAVTKLNSWFGSSGLMFPVELIGSLVTRFTHRTIGAAGATNMSAVLEYLCAELLEISGNAARDNARTIITPRDVFLTIYNDGEFRAMYSTPKMTVAGGGVIPNIDSKLTALPRQAKADLQAPAVPEGAAEFRFVGEAVYLAAEIEELEDLGEVYRFNSILRNPAEGPSEGHPFVVNSLPTTQCCKIIKPSLSHRAIGALCARAGVLKVSVQVYGELINTMHCFMEKLIRDTVTITEHGRKRDVSLQHVLAALEHQGREIWGLGLGRHATTSDVGAPLTLRNVPANLHSAFPDLIFDWQSAGAAAAIAAAEEEEEEEEEEEGEQKDNNGEKDEEKEWVKDVGNDDEEEGAKEGLDPETARHVAALRMIRQEQMRTGPCVPYVPFSEEISTIARGYSTYNTDLHFSVAANRAILEVVQSYLIGLLTDANFEAISSGRDCIEFSDIRIARRIHGDNT